MTQPPDPTARPTRAQFERWRTMLVAGELRCWGFTTEEGLAWLDRELAQLDQDAAA